MVKRKRTPKPKTPADELPIILNDLPDFIKRHHLEGARVVFDENGELALELPGGKDGEHGDGDTTRS